MLKKHFKNAHCEFNEQFSCRKRMFPIQSLKTPKPKRNSERSVDWGRARNDGKEETQPIASKRD